MSFKKKSSPTFLATHLEPYLEDGNISCKNAHQAANSANVSPLDIGQEANANDIRLTKCQLGLFGYGKPRKKLNRNMIVSDDLRDRIETSQNNGRISCLTCWEIAQELTLDRLVLGSACEILDIRIKPCQLGAF